MGEPELEQPPSGAASALRSFISGGIGGASAILVGHPLDLVKVRMQTASATSTASTSVFQILRQTLAQEGIRGIYRGVSAPLVAASPVYAISFWGYDVGQQVIRAVKSDPNEPLTITEKCVAGGLSAFPATVVTAPTERTKCLLQIQTAGGKSQYSGMVDCARQVYQSGGIRSLYKGTAFTLMRDVPGSIAWFGAYEVVKKSILEWQGIDDPSKLSPAAVIVAGGIAGMACWSVAIPPDVLKSRYQTAPDGKYKGILDVYNTLMKEEGAGALFTGVRPALIRAFPANAACFLGMEVAKKMFEMLD